MESISNKKAYFDYEISDTLEAGVELFGHEVKAIRTGKASLVGSLVKIYGGQVWLVGATIGPYQAKNVSADFEPTRSRRLLIKKSEIITLIGKTAAKNLTLVPLKLYNKRGIIKLEIGLGVHKNKSDKRETIRKREMGRNVRERLA
jgi:SsrA-binding protein